MNSKINLEYNIIKPIHNQLIMVSVPLHYIKIILVRHIFLSISLTFSQLGYAQMSNKCVLRGTVDWTRSGMIEVSEMVWKNNQLVPQRLARLFFSKHKFEISFSVNKPTLMTLSILNEDRKQHTNAFFYAEQGEVTLNAYKIQDEEVYEYRGSPRQDLFSRVMSAINTSEVALRECIQANDTLRLRQYIQQYHQYLADIAQQEGRQDFYYAICYGLLNVVPYHQAIPLFEAWYRDLSTEMLTNNWAKLLLKKIEINRQKKSNFRNAEEEFAFMHESIKKATFVDIEGNRVPMSHLMTGKIIIVTFWASWCAPCKGEIKELKKISEKYKDNKQVFIVSVSVDKDIDKWHQALKKEKMSWLQLLDQENLLEKLGVKYLPHSCIIDDNRYLGGGTNLEGYVYAILKQGLK